MNFSFNLSLFQSILNLLFDTILILLIFIYCYLIYSENDLMSDLKVFINLLFYKIFEIYLLLFESFLNNLFIVFNQFIQ